jgi:hypothetical protein
VRIALSAALGVALFAGAATAAPAKDAALTQAVAFWHAHHCEPAPDETMWEHGWRFNVLYGDCGGGDGHDQHVYFFDRGRFIGTDGLGTSSGIIGMWRDLDTIAFMYVLYRRHDPLCCATGGGAIVRYRFTGTAVKRLDPVPPRQLGKVALGR